MGTLDKLTTEQAGKLRRDARSKERFVCPRFMREAGSKRCVHYGDRGTCKLSDGFMCVEWLRANKEFDAAQAGLDYMTGHKPAADRAASNEGSASVERIAGRGNSGGFVRSPIALDEVHPDQLRALGAAKVVTEFEQSDGSRLRVVPRRTDESTFALEAGAGDVEITYDDLANVVTLAHAIPGTRLTKITRKGKG